MTTAFPSNQLVELLIDIQMANRRAIREDAHSCFTDFKMIVEGAILRAVRITTKVAKQKGIPPTIFAPPMDGGTKKEFTFQFVENLLVELTEIIGPIPSNMEDQIQTALRQELSTIGACENVTDGMYMFSYRSARSGVAIHVPLSSTAN